MSARILAVANRKGGTAKTTTTVNLAAALGARGLRVLLVDLDTQGHAGLGFGVRAAPGQPTVHDVFRGGGAAITRGIRSTAVPNVDVLPADRAFAGPDGPVAPLGLAAALKPLSEAYRVTLIDTAPTADALLINALASAHHVLVPTQLHHLSVDGVGQFARSFFRVATTLNPELRGLSILPSRSICGSPCSGRPWSSSRLASAQSACCRASARTSRWPKPSAAKFLSNTSSRGHARFKISKRYAATSWTRSWRSEKSYCWQI